jgi:transposase-like protein
MVAESFAPGASVSKVAQRYGVNANLLFTWRRRDARSAANGGVEAVELLPVRVEDERGARRSSRGAGSSRSHGDRAHRRRTDPCRGGH